MKIRAIADNRATSLVIDVLLQGFSPCDRLEGIALLFRTISGVRA
jgi:hypothetical protein